MTQRSSSGRGQGSKHADAWFDDGGNAPPRFGWETASNKRNLVLEKWKIFLRFI